MPKMRCVYGLCDPRDERVRYVGVTRTSLDVRLGCHLRDKDVNHRTKWIAKLKNEGVTPSIRVLEECPFDDDETLFALEIEWIATLREAGIALVNGTIGGDSGPLNSPGRPRQIVCNAGLHDLTQAANRLNGRTTSRGCRPCRDIKRHEDYLATGQSSYAIREWAWSQGIEMATFGPIPLAIKDAYDGAKK